MKIHGFCLVTALTVAAFALPACERGPETGEIDEEPVAEDTIGWDLEDERDADTNGFRAEAEEAGEAIKEGVKEGVEAVGAGTERLGREIQESVDTEEEPDTAGP